MSRSAWGTPSEWGGATTTDVHVVKDDVSLFDGDVSAYVNPNDSEHFSAVQTLAAGDIVDFAVGFGNGNYYCDTTFLEATISTSEAPASTPTPTPTSTPTLPPAVGGITELHVDGAVRPTGLADTSSSARPPYAALAGGAAAAALALAAGAWYVRRRWGR